MCNRFFVMLPELQRNKAVTFFIEEMEAGSVEFFEIKGIIILKGSNTHIESSLPL